MTRLAMIFPGQGPQYVGMNADLVAGHSVGEYAALAVGGAPLVEARVPLVANVQDCATLEEALGSLASV